MASGRSERGISGMIGEARGGILLGCLRSSSQTASRKRSAAQNCGGREPNTNTTAHVRRAALGAAICVLAAVGGARADVTASYDGEISVRKPKDRGSIAGALNQVGRTVNGSVAVSMKDGVVSGVFTVNGSARGGKVKLVGVNANGVALRWSGKVRKGGSLVGAAQLSGKRHMKAMLTMRRRSNGPPSSPPSTCDSSFFTGQVMGRVLKPNCAGCHVAGGAAQATSFRVTPTDARATMESVALHIDKAHPDESRILQKPLAQVPHAGGLRFVPGGDEHKILQQWVQMVATDTQCNGGGSVAMKPIPPADLLVRAAMDLRGMRPAPVDLDEVEASPAAYGALVDQYLQSPEFIDRVKDVYDDALLVRREDFTDEARDKTDAIYGEALELIAYIVKNNRPFTELGTADYTVANQLFQSDPNRLPYPMEPVMGMTWQPTHYLDGRPHAGLLSTSAFYQVWDTNNTNKNRRRANRISIVFHCYNFLDTIVDVTRNVDNNDPNAVLNAVTTRSDCKACHDKLDPLASFLFPMDNAQIETNDPNNFFTGDPERWRSANKRPPAVYGIPGADIRDMGRLLVANSKFAECQTKRAFKMLFLRDPKTNDEIATASDIATKWGPEDGWDFRKLVRRWMLSDVYTQRPVSDGSDWVRRASPERLENVIRDLTGFVWQRDPQDDEPDSDPASDPPRTAPVPLLTTEEDGFKIIMGGINGVNVSGRSYSLNASVAVVQRKVAALAAAYVLQNDLLMPDGQRRLLNGVTGTETPWVDDAALRTIVAGLVRRLYGQHVATNSPTVDAWMQLYTALWNDNTQGGMGSSQVPGTRSARAWRGLLTAMLRSPRILLY